MKSLKSLSILAAAFVSAFVFTMTACKPKCTDPTIDFNPATAAISKSPGEKINLDITVDCKDYNIKSIVVTKTSGGATSQVVSLTSIGAKNKTVSLVDSVPTNLGYSDIITYTVTAISDCKAGNSLEKTFKVTVTPSSTKLDPLFFEVKNSFSPYIYNRLASNTFAGSDNTAWDLQNRVAKYGANADTDKDICDSCILSNPYTPNVRWGSRNGSKFVKAAVGFDYANASAKSIVDAYNAGTPGNLIIYTANDVILVNIKNRNRYAAVTIRSIVEDGFPTTYEDYTFIMYKLAQ
jgi:hypothetical protein